MAYKIERKIIPGLTQKALSSRLFVVAHESGNPNNTGANSLDNEVSFMTRNWKNAYVTHWVGGGGRIVQVAEVGKFQYGAGPRANPYSYAQVELARTKDKKTFEKDYAAYVWLLRKLAGDGGIPKTLDAGTGLNTKGIKSHDWIRKYLGGTTHTDPFAYLASFGINRAQFKKDIESGVTTQTVEATKPQVSPAKIPPKSKPIWKKVTGNWTGQTLSNGQYGEPVKQLQTKMATNKPPFYPDKGAKNNGVDSYYGDDTEDAVRRVQIYYGLAVDGLAGKQVYNALQGKSTSNTRKYSVNVAVDGYWGVNVTKGLQTALGTVADGEIWGQVRNAVTSNITGGLKYGKGGSPMVKALQKKVGAKADGYLGKDTIRSMQRYLGTPADGELWKPSTMVKELQRRLNAGTF